MEEGDRGAMETTFADLPPEIVCQILREVVEPYPHMARVAAFVCRLWRELLLAMRDPPPPERDRRARERRSDNVITAAAAGEGGGRDGIALMEWARDNGCPLQPAAFARAAGSGRIETLAWLKESGCPWDASAC